MKISIAIKTAIGATVVLAGSGIAIFFLVEPGRPLRTGPAAQVATTQLHSPSVVHSATWYIAHPDVFKADEQRCAGDASTVSQAACQNVASAGAQLAGADYAKAAATLNAEPANSKPPNRQSP